MVFCLIVGAGGRVVVFYGCYRGDFIESSTSKVGDVCGNAAKFGRAIDADHVAVGRRRCLKILRTARRENTPEKYLKPPPIRQTRVDSLESYFRTVRRGNFDRPKKAGRGSRFSAFCGATAAALPGSLPACRSPVLREIPHILHLRKHPFQTFKDRRERRRGPLGFLRSRIPSFSIIPPGGLLGNVGILNVEKC